MLDLNYKLACIKKLKAGYKVLIMGNHDAGATNYRRQIIVHAAQTWIEDIRLFDEVYEGALQIGPKLLLSHEPVGSKYCLNIHGHVHKVNKLGSFTETVVPAIDYTNEAGHVHFVGYSYYSYNCCAEQINYMPVSLKTICESGYLKKVQDIHRATIDKAIDRKNNKKSSR